MITLRQIVPSPLSRDLAVGCGRLRATIAPRRPPRRPPPAAPTGMAPRPRRRRAMGMVLHKLNLTGAIRRPRSRRSSPARRASSRRCATSAKANREALATHGADRSGLCRRSSRRRRHNAATRITARAARPGRKIYEKRADARRSRMQIPGIVAAAQAAREHGWQAWKAQHPQAGSTGEYASALGGARCRLF